ncbi:MAG: hypothetical protein GXP25_23545 [Planctomycetes bacterium]|nr:hypothetical protein [Planctomycetota bacterium]
MKNDMNQTGDDTRFEDRLRAFSGPKPPDAVWEGIDKRIGERRKSRWLPVAFAAAAAVLIALTVAIVALRTVRRPGSARAGQGEFALRPAAALPGDDAANRSLSLVRLNVVMSRDPRKVFDYLELHSHPLRVADDAVMSIMETNGT